MASTTAAEGGSGSRLGWAMFLLLLAAVAVGGGGEGLDFSRPEAGSGAAASSNPCPPSKDHSEVVKRIGFLGKYELRCGKSDEYGWRKLVAKHGVTTKNMKDAYRCIGKVISRGVESDEGAGKTAFFWRYGRGRGEFAKVIVGRNGIITAYANMNRWKACAGA